MVKPDGSAVSARSPAHMTWAEIEAALNELKTVSRRDLRERVNEFAKAIDFADIPKVMAMLPQLPLEAQSVLRYYLLPRWAESDPRAAMEFANGLKNFNERHRSLLAVLRGWAIWSW